SGELEHLSPVFNREPRTVQPPPPEQLAQFGPRDSRRLLARPDVKFRKRSPAGIRPDQRHRFERPRAFALFPEPGLEFFLHVGLRDFSRPAIKPGFAAVIALCADEGGRRVGKNLGPFHSVAAAYGTIIGTENLVLVVANSAACRSGNLPRR